MYAPPSDNGMVADPVEKWAFFFQQAVKLTPTQLTDRLGEDPFAEAAGVLEMIARSPRERELYEARLKLQRDEQSRIEAAKDQSRAEGRAEGLQIGELAGRIRLMQGLLGLPISDHLDSLPLEQLASLESNLRERLEQHGKA